MLIISRLNARKNKYIFFSFFHVDYLRSIVFETANIRIAALYLTKC
jgi:hypothetical protein